MRKRWKGEERGNRVFKEGGEEEKRESEQRKAKEKTREVSPTIGVTLIDQKTQEFSSCSTQFREHVLRPDSSSLVQTKQKTRPTPLIPERTSFIHPLTPLHMPPLSIHQ